MKELKVLGRYVNGNYKVTLLSDGTKIRSNNLDSLIPEKPEAMDIKITNMCDMGCAFCHEDSKKDGAHGDIMNLPFLDTLLPYTELAIGGGNPLAHPDLVPFLEKCKEKKLICNMTVNQMHFIRNQELIRYLVDNELIYGLGVSLVQANKEFISLIQSYPNAVIHTINGVHTLQEYQALYDKNLKVLILGYKQFRRGVTFYSPEVEADKKVIYDNLPEIVKHFKVTSFDNLALKQLDVKRLLTKKEWEDFFMGDDGQFTMYVDAVKKEFATSSISTTRYPLMDDIKDMFDIIKKENKK